MLSGVYRVSTRHFQRLNPSRQSQDNSSWSSETWHDTVAAKNIKISEESISSHLASFLGSSYLPWSEPLNGVKEQQDSLPILSL